MASSHFYVYKYFALSENKSVLNCGLYYKQVTIIIYDRNDSGQYYKTTQWL